MFTFDCIKEEKFTVLVADSKQLASCEWEELIGNISIDEGRLKRYKTLLAKYNFLMGRYLLKTALIQSGLSTDLLKEMTYTPQGKPLIKGLYFSIAHANSQVVCVYTYQTPVGVDLDCERPLEIKHFKWWFADEEWRMIQQSTSPAYQLLELWTKKEAILKTYGATIAQTQEIRWLEGDKAQFKSLPAGQLYPIAIKGYICFVFLPLSE